MNLTEARATLIDSVLHVATGSYPADKQDRAIQFALNKFLRETRANRIGVTTNIGAGLSCIDMSNDLTDFHPAAFMHARIGWDEVVATDWRDVSRRQALNPTATAQPREVAFETPLVWLLYPTPDVQYTLQVYYWVPLIPFTAGTATPDAIEINCDERWVRDAIWFGAGPALVSGEAGNTWAKEGWQRFEALIRDVRGETNTSPGAVRRRNPDWSTRSPGISGPVV